MSDTNNELHTNDVQPAAGMTGTMTVSFEGDPRTYAVFTPAAAFIDRPPIVQIVQDLITDASLTVLSGAGGSGKTWAMLDMGACVAMGKEWLGRKVTQGAVLVIDEESGARRLHDRVGMVLRAHEANNDTPFFYTCLNGFVLSGENAEVSAAAITDLVRAFDARLVIVDALTDIALGLDENDAAQMAQVMKPLRMVVEATGAAVVVLHHTNKNGGTRGSTNIPALADLSMVLSRPERTEPVVHFKSDKARDVAEFEFAAELNFENGRCWLSPRKAVNVQRFGKVETYVMRWLEDNDEGQISDMVSEDEGMTLSKIRKAVSELKTAGHIIRTDKGKKTAAGTYALKPRPDAGQGDD